MKLLRFLALAVIVINSAFALANNPTPFVNQPLVPASVAPGGPTFTLTVNGTGFVSGSTVNWNGSPRATTFVNASQLTATILSTDIASANTGSVTVTSPTPGGGTSNVVFMPVREPAGFVSLNATSFNPQATASGMAAGDFNNDGSQDLAIGSNRTTSGVMIWLGNGDGTFRIGAEYSLVDRASPVFVAVADLNKDGKPDLITLLPGQAGFWVLLGNGDGTFRTPIANSTSEASNQVLVGDFHGNGALDAVFLTNDGFCIAPGNGDGSFQQTSCTAIGPHGFGCIAAGDFNSDGRLDLALCRPSGSNGLVIVLGNGDGTFQTARMSPPAGVSLLTVADFDGDGKLDLAAIGGGQKPLKVLLGNGDGTFRQSSAVGTSFAQAVLLTADLNGDGNLDLVTANLNFDGASISVFLGNGDGTFQNRKDYGGAAAASLALGDFNNDGRLDVAVSSRNQKAVVISLQDNGTVVSLAPTKIQFPTQLVGKVSDPRVVILTNNGAAPVTIKKISIDTGFLQFNNCHIVQPGGSCKIATLFAPTSATDFLGYLSINDDGGGSPQSVELFGEATVITLTPDHLDFGSLPVGRISSPQDVTVKNEGSSNVTITKISVIGDNPQDFIQGNACGSQLVPGQSCTVTVWFHPTAQGSRGAVLELEDNGGASPQKVPLSGTGT